jgi:carbon storage regulator CsrA
MFDPTPLTTHSTIKEDLTMLVLSRRIGEKLVIGDQITVSINRVSGNRVSLGIEAPPDVRIVRSELKKALLDVLSAEDPAHTESGAYAVGEAPARALQPLSCR